MQLFLTMKKQHGLKAKSINLKILVDVFFHGRKNQKQQRLELENAEIEDIIRMLPEDAYAIEVYRWVSALIRDESGKQWEAYSKVEKDEGRIYLDAKEYTLDEIEENYPDAFHLAAHMKRIGQSKALRTRTGKWTFLHKEDKIVYSPPRKTRRKKLVVN